ncbi:MAG: peptidase streptopain [Sphingobacteriales bacterium]|nr:peptidase streptopain [Sphingobacteriales bacterium]
MKTTKYLFLIGVLFLSFCKKDNHFNNGIKVDNDLIQNLDSNFINLNDALLLAKEFKSPGEKNASSLNNKIKGLIPSVSVSTTEKKIKNYYIYSEKVDNSTARAASKRYVPANEPLLYLINYEGGGLSIVSSDKRFGNVLATIDQGITVEQNMEAPDAFINYLVHAANSIKAIKENKLVSKEKELSKNAKSGNIMSAESECDGEFYYPWGTLNWTCMGPFDTFVTNSGPLVQTMWGQGVGYNDQLTYICGTSKAPTGCVATAMAQAMSVYRYPTLITGCQCLIFQGVPRQLV